MDVCKIGLVDLFTGLPLFAALGRPGLNIVYAFPARPHYRAYFALDGAIDAIHEFTHNRRFSID
jgi:hypothetical protein